MLGASGRPLRRSRSYDTEALAISGGTAFVAVERSHGVLRFPWAKDGVRARAQAVSGPAELRDLPRNQGLEATGVAPPAPPCPALSWRSSSAPAGVTASRRGFILSGPRADAFDVARTGPFDVTDLAFLPPARSFSWSAATRFSAASAPASAASPPTRSPQAARSTGR
jgi:hypothetical protein